MQQPRNAPCACGSGKKFKKCCGSLAPRLGDDSLFGALIQLGNTDQAAGRLDDAVSCFRRAIALAPRSAVAHYNLGNALRFDEQIDAAVAAYRQALALQPELIQAHCNLAGLLLERRESGDIEAAAAHYRHSIALQPEFADAHCNHAFLLLLSGSFHDGWQEYEWRWKTPIAQQKLTRYRACLRWQVENLVGRSILLHAEQGFGDTLQFVRYAPLLASRGARVVLECQQPLVRLLSTIPGIDEVIAYGQTLPSCDFHPLLLSLSGIFGTAIATIPADLPYLEANRESAERWRALAGEKQLLNVGLVWAGNPLKRDPESNRVGRRRSIPLALFAPLGGVPRVRYFSLQEGDGAEQTSYPPAGLELIDHTGELNDFADTAGLISTLDLVVSVDTSVAHLAGAMGKPVWLLSRWDGCGRWLLDGEETPWDPSMRIFRQRTRGDWPSVIAQVAAELARMLRERSRVPAVKADG